MQPHRACHASQCASLGPAIILPPATTTGHAGAALATAQARLHRPQQKRWRQRQQLSRAVICSDVALIPQQPPFMKGSKCIACLCGPSAPLLSPDLSALLPLLQLTKFAQIGVYYMLLTSVVARIA